MQTATIIGVLGTSGISASPARSTIGAYTVPASTGAVVSHLFIANTSNGTITCNVVASNGVTTVFLANNAPIAVGDSLNVLDGSRITLAAGWTIQAGATGSADASMSVTQFV